MSTMKRYNELGHQPIFHIQLGVTNALHLQVWILSDGGRAHFKSRISFYFMTTLPDLFGMFHALCAPSNTITGAVFHWLFSPSNHGKGECDSHGAVVKRGIRLFVLDGVYLEFCLHLLIADVRFTSCG